MLTITNAFGVPADRALDIRESLRRPDEIIAVIAPIVAARREAPRDDLISVLVEAEMTGEDGVTHRLTDAEIYSFTMLLLQAGSGTTWKQMGITLTADLVLAELRCLPVAHRPGHPGRRAVPATVRGSQVSRRVAVRPGRTSTAPR